MFNSILSGILNNAAVQQFLTAGVSALAAWVIGLINKKQALKKQANAHDEVVNQLHDEYTVQINDLKKQLNGRA